ncbi:MAG: hypothetical protein GY852_02570, partial [bacterium]|nr:hypothetical protein [bacterium]
ADFCGPDGSPLLSFLLDSTGCLLYQPAEASAFYVFGGIPAGGGVLDVNAVIALIRTGFPAIPIPWEMVASCDTTEQSASRWFFSSLTSDAAMVSLKPSELFPTFFADDISIGVTATSWHDQFNAWPMEWRLRSPSVSALVRIRSFNTETHPSPSIWRLAVPVPVDTVLVEGGYWRASFELPIR